MHAQDIIRFLLFTIRDLIVTSVERVDIKTDQDEIHISFQHQEQDTMGYLDEFVERIRNDVYVVYITILYTNIHGKTRSRTYSRTDITNFFNFFVP